MDLIVFILICYGATNIVTGSKLFRPLRESFDRFMSTRSKLAVGFPECPMCVGFWVGVFVSLVWVDVLNPIADGLISSGVCWLLHVVESSLGSGDL